MTNEANIVPVILCGGAGTRLWPESRENRPKHFLNITGEGSLLEQTIKRAAKVAKVEFRDIVIVTLSKLEIDIRAELEKFCQKDNIPQILSEPSARDTAAAVALAVCYTLKKYTRKGDKQRKIWVLPADHFIGDEDTLQRSLQRAESLAGQGALVTFGIEPTRPETGYGYIRLGKALNEKNSFQVDSFIEKPNLTAAKQYIQQGGYVWNSGMFLFTAETGYVEFQKHAQDIIDQVEKATNSDTQINGDIYAQIEKKPFDRAVMEKSDKINVVCCDPQWSDIGSWESLWEISMKDESGNVLIGNVVAQNVQNSFVKSYKKVIACTDVEDIVVVETEDAILIANRKDGNSVKELVTKLKEAGFSQF
nr:NTP transferase domain-containing protein [Cytophagales bacterium]